MSEKYSNFRSQSEITARNEENRKARELILEHAKKKYEAQEAREEKARKQGEGTWMLNSVSHRVSKEEKDLEKKKRKKEKKKKKKKKKKHASSSSESGSEDNGDEGKWVENKAEKDSTPSGIVKGPQLQRESWMESPLDLIPMTSRQEIRAAAQREKEEAKRELEKLSAPGQHARELNPYWRDGGTGLPEEKKAEKASSHSSLPSAGSGDGGLSWLRKGYERCQQQASDEGRSLEEVAAERWGSLKKLESMLAEAERKHREDDKRGDRRDGRRDENSGRRDNRNREEERSRDRDNSRDREPDREKDRRRDTRDRDEERRVDRRGSDRDERPGLDRDRRRDEARGDGGTRRLAFQRPGSDSEGESSKPSRSRFKRPGDDDDDEGRGDRRSKHNGFKRPSESDDRGSSRRESDDRDSSRFMKPGDNREERKDNQKRGFMRPGDRDGERSEKREERRRRSRSPEENVPRWKKKPAPQSPKDRRGEGERRKEGNKRGKRKSRSPSPSSSDSSSSSESEDGALDRDDSQAAPPAPPAKILSEEELNELAAKILRAEIMGDDDVVADLKSKLEDARKAREESKSQGGTTAAPDFSHRRRGEGGSKKGRGRKREGGGSDEEGDDNVVVLSRTSKGGLVRPVLGASDEWGAGARGGKKRKKNATTHDIGGERTIYFDDDDKYDLKQLVEQERAGTAEDQNAMFSRLAGRSQDKDLDVDDMFVSKAARKQNTEQAAMKDRAGAIFEHKKISAAMEKCSRCFDKVPKHLIIAIGTKSYLCLPAHRSLAEGHCLIVPMQHVSASTSMDEDVWQEMQLFRKTLVQMFAAQDQDLVVMETVMHLKHFPHTALEIVPLDREIGDLSPIYFKKAIQEVGPEWSDNKKLHSLSQKDVRHVIPKGFPYFAVDFGLQGGYATVIEDEATFPAYFGREIVGGMLDAEPTLWRKPHKQSFEDQRQKVLQFEQWWKPFDWTQNLGAGD